MKARTELECARALAANRGAMTKHELANTLKLGKGTAWDRLVAMEHRGYVTRQPGAAPMDPAVFTLTDSGRTLAMCAPAKGGDE